LKEEEEDLQDTAVREAEEEVGIDPAHVHLLGELSPVFIPPTGFHLHPFVGAAHVPLRPRINSTEVARILEVPVTRLLDLDNVRSEVQNFRGQDFEVPFYFLGGEKIWGATAMILAELVWILDAGPDSDGAL
jgi:8-oxo-dGTP pyrophosphatase MutT (NUDIX family)